MKTAIFLALAIVSGTFAATARAADPDGKETRQADEPRKVLYHVVSIKFKETASPEQIKAVEDAFRALKAEVPGITSLHWGTNVSPEKRNMGFTHCFILTFADARDRDAYLTHPAHKDFGKLLGPVMADVFVIDFWARD